MKGYFSLQINIKMKSDPFVHNRHKFREKYFPTVVNNKYVQNNVITDPSKSNIQMNLPLIYKKDHTCMHRLTHTLLFPLKRISTLRNKCYLVVVSYTLYIWMRLNPCNVLEARIIYKKWISIIVDHFFKWKVKTEVNLTSFDDNSKLEVWIYMFPKNMETQIDKKYPTFCFNFSFLFWVLRNE